MSNLIPERLRVVRKKVDHGVQTYILEKVEREDLIAWSESPEIPQKMTMSILCDVPKKRFIGYITP